MTQRQRANLLHEHHWQLPDPANRCCHVGLLQPVEIGGEQYLVSCLIDDSRDADENAPEIMLGQGGGGALQFLRPWVRGFWRWKGEGPLVGQLCRNWQCGNRSFLDTQFDN